MLNTTVSGNTLLAENAPQSFVGGGVLLFDRAQIIGSSITGNSVGDWLSPPGKGGGIYVDAETLLDRSVVGFNLASDGGGGAVPVAGVLLAVRNSTVHDNLAVNGAGIFNQGVLTITNSTLYLNAAATDGGGLYNGNRAHLDSTTVVSNVADFEIDNLGDGGGIFVQNGKTLFLRSSLLAGNKDRTTRGPALPDCAGSVVSLDYNLIQQTPSPSGCNVTGATAHNKIGTFAGVVDSTLKNNGGTTPTLALPPRSAAINAGDPSGCKDENGNPLTTDQRGFARVGPCDIGAFEFVLRGFLPLIRR